VSSKTVNTNIIGEALLKYWQLLMAFIFIVVGWTLFESRLGAASIEIKELKEKVSQQEERYQEYQKESLQRLSSIEAKVDFLVNTSSVRGQTPTEEPVVAIIPTYRDLSIEVLQEDVYPEKEYKNKGMQIKEIRMAMKGR
jgi:hypothetical protein